MKLPNGLGSEKRVAVFCAPDEEKEVPVGSPESHRCVARCWTWGPLLRARWGAGHVVGQGILRGGCGPDP